MREPCRSGSGHLYHLTDAGAELAPILDRLSHWGKRWVLGNIDPGRLDVTALMWAVRRRADPSVFGEDRVVVQFEFIDQPQAKQQWWLVNDAGDVDLCPKDPGFDVDVHVATDFKTMAEIWVGKLPLDRAAEMGRRELAGAGLLTRAFRSWLRPFAGMSAADRIDMRAKDARPAHTPSHA